MIDKATVQRIKDAADIVDVVSDYVKLTRRGANYMGLCPFHNERTPSFSVNKRKNFCYCFSCHKGGSPVNFIMEKEGISYHDALLQLAAKYGIEVNERELTDEERTRQNMRDAMYVANDWAMQQMQSNLRNTDEGRDVGLSYFYQRGLTDEAINAFRLGYAIDRGDSLVKAAYGAGYDLQVLHSLGLLGKAHDSDRMYDRFRGRVIFPIFTTSGKVVAFGGRTLKGDKAKYINSPESEIYRKSNELYGLYQAKNAIVKADKCFLVEGYMDVIGMWQSGMQNVVASSGTALTDGQIALIHRFTSKVTLIYDGDNAGIKAALRGIDMLLSHRLEVKVLLLPDGHDPDSFARENTPEQFRKYVEENETDIIRFKTKILLEHSGGDPQKRAEAIRSIVASLACIPDNISRTVYIGECARLLGVSENVIAIETRRAREAAVRKVRTEREYAHIAASEGNQPREAAPNAPTATTPVAVQEQARPTPPQPQRLSPLQRRLLSCERETLRYCIRYGRLDYGEGIDEQGQTTRISVIDFVDFELGADGVSFSHQPYARIFQLLKDMKEEYAEALLAQTERIDCEIEERRRQGFEEIGRLEIDMSEMQSREKILETNLQEERAAALFEFASFWPANELASHEDDLVRSIATELITAKYQISRVYTAAGYIDDERLRLGELVARSVDEWKDTLLQIRQNEIRNKLAQAAANDDFEEVVKCQKELADLIALRGNVAKSIGDRVVAAK